MAVLRYQAVWHVQQISTDQRTYWNTHKRWNSTSIWITSQKISYVVTSVGIDRGILYSPLKISWRCCAGLKLGTHHNAITFLLIGTKHHPCLSAQKHCLVLILVAQQAVQSTLLKPKKHSCVLSSEYGCSSKPGWVTRTDETQPRTSEDEQQLHWVRIRSIVVS